jgi:hypothetical protein
MAQRLLFGFKIILPLKTEVIMALVKEMEIF